MVSPPLCKVFTCFRNSQQTLTSCEQNETSDFTLKDEKSALKFSLALLLKHFENWIEKLNIYFSFRNIIYCMIDSSFLYSFFNKF